jgi:molybdopterin synthase catalytic subunit
MQEARAVPKIPPTGVYAKGSLNYAEILDEVVRTSADSTGGIATYVGMTKSPGFAHKEVKALLIETDPEVSAKGLRRLCEEVKERFHLQLALVYHYEGSFRPGEMLVFIVVAAKARPEVFGALEEIVNRFKTEGHIRKKEIFEHGESEWIDGEAACPSHA